MDPQALIANPLTAHRFQVVLLILALALYDSSPKAGAVIMFFVGVDALLFVLR